MGVETWNRGNVNVWEPTTNRKVHLEGTGPHTVRSSNKAVTYLTIWDGAGDDDISVGSLNTHTGCFGKMASRWRSSTGPG